MKKSTNELLMFLAGLAMLIAGLFILSQRVMVSNGFFSGGLTLSSMQLNNGLIMIPLIIGIVWMFASGGSFGSKIVTGIGVFIIIAAIIASTRISLVTMSMYDWVIILILIFGGAGLLARVLFSK